MSIQPYKSTDSCQANPTDVFNNPSNDYVVPNLGSCQGMSDDKFFTFLDKSNAGIISGKDVLATMSLGSINIPVDEYTTKTQTLQTGEIIYIPGLDKGLQYKSQSFILPDLNVLNQQLYFEIDLSINYYNNFSYITQSINGKAESSTNIDINTALDLSFSNQHINVASLYDPSAMAFVGTAIGYEFEVNNVVLTIIDASMDATSPFPSIIIDGEHILQTYDLDEDKSALIPGMKYPNGAMKGFMILPTYPTEACESDKWLYLNHVKSPFDVYYEQNSPTGISDITTNKIYNFGDIDFGDISIGFEPIPDISIGDFAPFPTPDVDSSIIDPPSSKLLNYLSISNSTINNPAIGFSQLLDSSIIAYRDPSYGSEFDPEGVIYKSAVYNCLLKSSGWYDVSTADPSAANYPNKKHGVLLGILDSSIINSEIEGDDVSIYMDMTLESMERLNIQLTSSEIKHTNVVGAYFGYDCLLIGDVSNNINLHSIFNSVIQNAEIKNMVVYGSKSIDAKIQSSEVINSYITNTKIDNTNISTSEINSNTEISNSILVDNSINDTNIQTSSLNHNSLANTNIISSIINDNIITDCSIQNSYLNYIELAPGLLMPDPSASPNIITNTNIYDASIYNSNINDCSIYDSNILDSSLYGCTIYNSIVDPSNYLDPSTKNIYINTTIDCSITWTEDTSLLYEKYTKKVDVGMNGDGDNTVLSAGEYLSYINEHDMWYKTGAMISNFSAPDPENSNIKNLIGGFYVFNAQRFPVQIEYILIN